MGRRRVAVTPEPPPRPAPTDVLAAVARRAQPLLLLWLYGGIEAWLVLTLFDLCLGLAAIPLAVLVRAVAPTVADSPAATLDQRVTAVALMAFLAACFVVPFGMPLVFLGAAADVAWRAALERPGFWASAGVCVLLAGRGLLAMPRTGAVPEPAAAQSAVALQMALLVGFYALVLATAAAGRPALVALPPAFAAVLVVHDLRPDLLRRIWR